MATATIGEQTDLYLYGITTAEGTLALPRQGLGGFDLQPVLEGRLAAIVSRLPDGKLRPQRSNLSAHHRVLRDIALTQPVLD